MEGLAFINLKLNVEKCPSNGNKRFQGGLPQCTISIWFLAAGGPYWVLISQKVGSLFQSLGVLISLGDSDTAVPRKTRKLSSNMIKKSWINWVTTRASKRTNIFMYCL